MEMPSTCASSSFGRVHHRGRVGGQLGDRERRRDRGRVADPAVVEDDAVEVGFEAREEGLSPAQVGAAQALDQEQRLAPPGALPIELDSVRRGRHGGIVWDGYATPAGDIAPAAV